MYVNDHFCACFSLFIFFLDVLPYTQRLIQLKFCKRKRGKIQNVISMKKHKIDPSSGLKKQSVTYKMSIYKPIFQHKARVDPKCTVKVVKIKSIRSYLITI